MTNALHWSLPTTQRLVMDHLVHQASHWWHQVSSGALDVVVDRDLRHTIGLSSPFLSDVSSFASSHKNHPALVAPLTKPPRHVETMVPNNVQ